MKPYEQNAQVGLRHGPVSFQFDCSAKSSLGFVKTFQRQQRIATLELSFWKLGLNLERLFIELQCSFQISSCMCILTSFEELRRVRCIVVEAVLGLSGSYCSAAQRQRKCEAN